MSQVAGESVEGEREPVVDEGEGDNPTSWRYSAATSRPVAPVPSGRGGKVEGVLPAGTKVMGFRNGRTRRQASGSCSAAASRSSAALE